MSTLNERMDYYRNRATIKAARVEGDRLLLTLESDAILSLDARRYRELAPLSEAQLSHVILTVGRSVLLWPDGGASLTVEWLIETATGMQSLKSAQRKGGSSRSEAKVAAVRANGAKGGRPKKNPVESA
ncbi:MAG TPA: DUF2442 domain-containing protein [Abditibacterium sp.]|jgi:hypothetical protein